MSEAECCATCGEKGLLHMCENFAQCGDQQAHRESYPRVGLAGHVTKSLSDNGVREVEDTGVDPLSQVHRIAP